MFKKKSSIFLLALLFIFVTVISFSYFAFRSGQIQDFVLQKVIDKTDGLESPDLDFVRNLLGFDKPHTFLILFLNNTEMRPGGGFIGVYAVVKVDKGQPKIIKVEGTETIDNNSPKDFLSIPPLPIKKYLGVDRWYFRDSNWSPDFSLSAQKSLELYIKERGELSKEVDTVVGFTPTLLEKFLAIVGPIEVDGIKFTAENFTETLEYEVEYGYADRALSFDQRKKILEALTKKIISAAGKNVFSSWVDYKGLFEDMVREKQIMFYSKEESKQQNFITHGWAGEMKKESTDYLLWVDANLGALKTDWILEKQLSYEMFKKDNKYYGRVKMNYIHKGKFDWRTSRYLSYSRLFVPRGSKLVENKDMVVDQGEENGRRWFGTYFSIEPGKTKNVVFEFELSSDVVNKIQKKDYSLLCQKQLGSNGVGLTIKLNFDTKVVVATPRENKGVAGDNVFEYADVMDSDKLVKINIE